MPLLYIVSKCSLNGEGSEYDVVVQDAGSSRKQRSLLEVDLVNIRPSTSESLLLHIGHQAKECTRRREAYILRDNRLALALAGESKCARDRSACNSLLRRSNAAEVEALQREVGCLAADGLESRGVIEAGSEEILHGDVGFGLWCDSDGGERDVDDVETVPVETFVSADGLQRCYGNCDCNIIKLY
jgi:hypothetical protein